VIYAAAPMAYQVRIKSHEAQRFMAARARTAPADCGFALETLLGEVWAALNALPHVTVGPPIARFHSVDEGVIEVEAGFPVAEQIAGTERVAAAELPRCTLATVIHEGPYDGLPEAHAHLADWLADQADWRADGPAWEVYWVDASQVESPAELRTEVAIPIRASRPDRDQRGE